MEARARDILQAPAAESPAVETPAATTLSGANSIDMSSFPLLLLHQLPAATTEVLEQSQQELGDMIKSLPASSPLLSYASKQQAALKKELSKRSAAARVERMILGLQSTPPVKAQPVLMSNPTPMLKQERKSTRNKYVTTVAAKAVASSLEPAPVHVSKGFKTTTTKDHAKPDKNSVYSELSSDALHDIGQNTQSSAIAFNRRPASISAETERATKSSEGARHELDTLSRPRPNRRITNGTAKVQSAYSQKALQLERLRKKISVDNDGWGSSFVIGGGKKKTWENKIAKRRRAEERKRDAEEKRRVEQRKASRTSKHIQSVRQMLRIKQLRRKERAKRRKVLEDLRQQISKQSASRMKTQSKSATKKVAQGSHRSSIDAAAQNEAEEVLASGIYATTSPRSATIKAKSPLPDLVPPRIAKNIVPTGTTTSDLSSFDITINDRDQAEVSRTDGRGRKVKGGSDHRCSNDNIGNDDDYYSTNTSSSGSNDDDDDDADSNDDDDDDEPHTEIDIIELHERQDHIARIDKVLRKLDDCQKRDDDIEREMIEDPDKFLELGRIEEVEEEEYTTEGHQITAVKKNENCENSEENVMPVSVSNTDKTARQMDNVPQESIQQKKETTNATLLVAKAGTDLVRFSAHNAAPLSSSSSSSSELPTTNSGESEEKQLGPLPPKGNNSPQLYSKQPSSTEALNKPFERAALVSVQERGGPLLPQSPERSTLDYEHQDGIVGSAGEEILLEKTTQEKRIVTTGSIYADALCMSESESIDAQHPQSEDSISHDKIAQSIDPPAPCEPLKQSDILRMPSQGKISTNAKVEANAQQSDPLLGGVSDWEEGDDSHDSDASGTDDVACSESRKRVNEWARSNKSTDKKKEFSSHHRSRSNSGSQPQRANDIHKNAKKSNLQQTRGKSVGEHLPQTKTMYADVFHHFADIFTGAHDFTSRELNKKGASSRSLHTKNPSRRKQRSAFDEEEYLVYHIEQLKRWFTDMGQYENAFTVDRTVNIGESSTFLSPRARSEYIKSNRFVKGMYYITRQSRGRSEVVDIVTATMEKSDVDWTQVPPCLSGGTGRRGDGTATAHYWNLIWTWSRPRVNYERLLTWQRVNHFPGARHLTRKDCLKRNLDRYTKVPGKLAESFRILPDTFCLPKEYLSFVETFSRVAEEEELKYPHRPPGSMNWWILKPAGLSRGRGITVVNDICQVTYGSDAVIQRYIMNPHLLDGYKYDLRIYVLVTSFNPLEAFVYNEGFVRFSTVPYSTDPSSVSNKFIHLTNSSIQKHNMGSVPSEDNKGNNYHIGTSSHPADRAFPSEKGGTKLKLSYLWRRFTEDGINAEKVCSDIEEVLVKTLMVANDAIPNQINSFELYGFDIMIDSKLKPWLIEVNASPSLACDFQVDIDVKHALMQDIIRIVDPLEFDREVLLEQLEARLEQIRDEKKRPYANPTDMYRASRGQIPRQRSELDRMLNTVLGGKKPRIPAATPPPNLGNFKQIAPGGVVFQNTQRLMQKCLHSHRR